MHPSNNARFPSQFPQSAGNFQYPMTPQYNTQSQQFIQYNQQVNPQNMQFCQPVLVQNNSQNFQTRPGGAQNVFQAYNPGMSTQPVAQQQTHAFPIQSMNQKMPYHNSKDKEKFLDDRKKFQHQQRLKAFNKVGVKPSINADTFMKNIIGETSTQKKVTPKPVPQNVTEDLFGDFVQCEPNIAPTSESYQNLTSSDQISHKAAENIKLASSFPVQEVKKSFDSEKGIDSMMEKCSDLHLSKKATSFRQKVTMNEVVPTKAKTQVYAESNKACDWSKVSTDLGESFHIPTEMKAAVFPEWCIQEKVPELYHKIEILVTNAENTIDTGLLYSLLMTSGLPQPLLAFVWGLANRTTPGQLTQQEFYCTLALVAVAQAGHAFKSIEILHQFLQPPVPYFPSVSEENQDQNLQEVKSQAASELITAHSENVVAVNNSQNYNFDNQNQAVAMGTSMESVTPEQEFGEMMGATMAPQCDLFLRHLPIPGDSTLEVKTIEKQNQFEIMPTPKFNSGNYRRAALDQETCLKSSGVANDGTSLLNIATNIKKDAHVEDEFDDFVSATEPELPTQIEKLNIDNNDDFADFQHASASPQDPPFQLNLSSTINLPHVDQKKDSSDLMTIEQDKYSAFRELSLSSFEQDKENNSDSSNNLENNLISDESYKSVAPEFEADFSKFDSKSNDDDNFGDFNFCAEVPQKSMDSLHLPALQKKNEPTLFETQSNSSLEFGNFGSNDNLKGKSLPGDSQSIASLELDSASFQGDFKLPKKDNISLGENQSIASLEFGSYSYDQGVQSSDSKSPISKSDSTPSLDLKVVSVDNSSLDIDDEFGEMVSANSNSGSCADNKPIDASVVLQNSSKNGLLVDKYSLVRNKEQANECEDIHTNEWFKCLKSCIEILTTANSIFNSMSSSSVCNEVLSTEEGSTYYKNVIEVYRVARRVSLSIDSFNKCDVQIEKLLKDINLIWNNLAAFISGTSIMPDENSFDYSSGIIHQPNQESLEKACGVCLLNVDSRSKEFNRDEDEYKLMYGGRQYHSSCANLWVNCVNSILPSLPLPELF